MNIFKIMKNAIKGIATKTQKTPKTKVGKSWNLFDKFKPKTEKEKIEKRIGEKLPKGYDTSKLEGVKNKKKASEIYREDMEKDTGKDMEAFRNVFKSSKFKDLEDERINEFLEILEDKTLGERFEFLNKHIKFLSSYYEDIQKDNDLIDRDELNDTLGQLIEMAKTGKYLEEFEEKYIEINDENPFGFSEF